MLFVGDAGKRVLRSFGGLWVGVIAGYCILDASTIDINVYFGIGLKGYAASF